MPERPEIAIAVPARRRRRDPRTVLAVLAGILALALIAAEVPLDIAAHTFSVSNTGYVFLIVIPFAAVGVLVSFRQAGNPIGWLLLAFAILVLVGDCTGDYALLGYRYGHPSLPLRGAAAALAKVASVAPVVVLPVPILLFPDGLLPARWRRVLRTYVGLGAIAVGSLAIDAVLIIAEHRVRIDSTGAITAKGSSGGAVASLKIVATAAEIAVVPIWISIVARQVRRYRRAAGLERAQLKWLVLGASASMGAIVYFVSGLGNGTSALADVFSTIVGLGFAGLPVSMGVAILRYRLYDINRLISRTLSYAILTGLLVGTFIGLVALSTNTLALSGRVGVAASTLAAAALFNPLRIRVQRLVDRRFNRARYDAEATVAAFNARLRDAVEIDAIRADLLDAVNRAVQPAHASIWIRHGPPA